MSGGEIYIEYIPSGHAFEVVAIDAETATEIRFIAPRDTPEADIRALVRSKMNYVLSRNSKKIVGHKPPGDRRRGIIV